MRKMKFLTVLTASAITLSGFTSCDLNKNIADEGKKGEPTSMQFVINAPKAMTTYAPVDGNATQDEIDLKSVDVLIYEQVSTGFQLEQIAHRELVDFDIVSGSDKYKLKSTSKISTTTGVKKIFVAMNYKGPYPAVGTSISAVEKLQASLAAPDDLSNSKNGFAMFSTAATSATLVPEDHVDYAKDNTATVTVKRLVAKVSVQEGTALRTNGEIKSEGGWITNLQFAVGNINKSVYLLQNLVKVGSDFVVHDPNWDTFAASDFFDIKPTTAVYKSVDVANATVAAGTIHPAYVTENTAKTYDLSGANMTYVSIRAQYIPEFFCDASGASKGANSKTTTPVSFWTVIRSNGQVYYFDAEANATTFAGIYPGAIKSSEYTNAHCYWRGYLNPNGTDDGTITGNKAAKFDVLRNVYYKTSIKGIKAPGQATDEGKVTESTSLIMEVEVQSWFKQDDEWIL
jgi:hypothetical protein